MAYEHITDHADLNALVQEEWETGLEAYADEYGYTVAWGEQLSETGFYFALVGADYTEDELEHVVETASRDAHEVLGGGDDYRWHWERVAYNTYRVTTLWPCELG